MRLIHRYIEFIPQFLVSGVAQSTEDPDVFFITAFQSVLFTQVLLSIGKLFLVFELFLSVFGFERILIDNTQGVEKL